MKKEENLQNQGCGNASCECAAPKDDAREKEIQAAKDKIIADKKILDPTHFGDWQIGCRAIDF